MTNQEPTATAKELIKMGAVSSVAELTAVASAVPATAAFAFLQAQLDGWIIAVSVAYAGSKLVRGGAAYHAAKIAHLPRAKQFGLWQLIPGAAHAAAALTWHDRHPALQVVRNQIISKLRNAVSGASLLLTVMSPETAISTTGKQVTPLLPIIQTSN